MIAQLFTVALWAFVLGFVYGIKRILGPDARIRLQLIVTPPESVDADGHK